MNSVNNNVVSGADKSAYALYGGDNTPPPAIQIPAFQGADPEVDFISVMAETMTLQSFNGNVAYASHMGVELWYMGFANYYSPTQLPIAWTTVHGLSLWNINHTAIFGIQVNSFRWEDVKIVGDASQINPYNLPIGILVQVSLNVEFKNLIVDNMRWGIESPTRTAVLDPTIPLSAVVPLKITGGRLANEINAVIASPSQDAFIDFALGQSFLLM